VLKWVLLPPLLLSNMVQRRCGECIWKYCKKRERTENKRV
jgi:hypothetical protein